MPSPRGVRAPGPARPLPILEIKSTPSPLASVLTQSSPLLVKSYWRIAGMSYLKYSSMCAEVVRGCLKEPFLTKVSRRFPRCAPGTPAVRADYSLARACSSRPL